MPQREFTPREYAVVQENGHAEGSTSTDVSLESTDGDVPFRFTFQAVRPGLFRTTFSSKTHPLPPHPSTPRPASNLDGLNTSSKSSGRLKTINVGGVTATVDWSGPPLVSLQLDGQPAPIHRDLDFRSYVADSTGIAHYTRYKRDTLHVGLGEKAAPMNLSNRNFIISATDCLATISIGRILSTNIFLSSSMPRPTAALAYSRHPIAGEHTPWGRRSMGCGGTSKSTGKTMADWKNISW